MIRSTLLPIIVTLVLLSGIGVQRMNREAKPENIGKYHANISEALKQVPYDVGKWLGQDQPVKYAVMQMLNTTDLVSRQYKNYQTGEQVGVVLVHCKDVRDILGHYPVKCYPSHGWSLASSKIIELEILGEVQKISEYEFEIVNDNVTQTITILNMMLIPDHILPDMKKLNEAGKNQKQKHYGAGQVQLIFASDVESKRRYEIADDLISGFSHWMEEIVRGETDYVK